MTRFLEIAYYVALPIGLAMLLGALLGRRAWPRIASVTAALALLSGWFMDARWLSDRSALLLNHYEVPLTTQQIVDWFGQPDRIVTYPEGDSSWIYTVRVRPFRAEIVYAVFHNRIVGRRAAETMTALDTSKLRPVPEPVLKNLADNDPVTWVIMPMVPEPDDWVMNNHFYSRWSPNKKDIPALIEATFEYLWLFKEPQEKDDSAIGTDSHAKNRRTYEEKSVVQVLINRPIYACQIVGYEKDGRKMIHMNFFPKNEEWSTTRKPGTNEPYWHFRYVQVMDGGAWFWQIEYDPATKTFSDFRANGMG